MWRSSCYWYQRIDAILALIDLIPSPHDPCLYADFVRDPLDNLAAPLTVPLSLGLYVDNFIRFLADPAVETLFECLLKKRVNVNFMRLVE